MSRGDHNCVGQQGTSRLCLQWECTSMPLYEMVSGEKQRGCLETYQCLKSALTTGLIVVLSNLLARNAAQANMKSFTQIEHAPVQFFSLQESPKSTDLGVRSVRFAR